MRQLRVVLPTAIAVAACAAGAAPAVGATWTIVPARRSGAGACCWRRRASATSAWAVGGNGDGSSSARTARRWTAVTSPEPARPQQPEQLGDAQRSRCDISRQRVRGRRRQRRGGGTVQRHELDHDLGPEPRRLMCSTTSRRSPHRRVGGRPQTPTFNGLTLARHWQGSSWDKVATPSPGTRDNTLLRSRAARRRRLGGRLVAQPALRQPHEAITGDALNGTPGAASRARLGAQTVLEDVVALSPTKRGRSATRAAPARSCCTGTARAGPHAPAPALSSLTASPRCRPSHLGERERHRRELPCRQLARLGLDDSHAPAPFGRGTPQLSGMAAARSRHRVGAGPCGTAPTAPATRSPSARRTADLSDEVDQGWGGLWRPSPAQGARRPAAWPAGHRC